jgi:hypothetical protein
MRESDLRCATLACTACGCFQGAITYVTQNLVELSGGVPVGAMTGKGA